MMNRKKWFNEVWAMLLLLIAVTGCNSTPNVRVLDEIYALDSVMIAGLEHPDTLPATLDSLSRQGETVADTAIADLSFAISNAMLHERQFTQLKTYTEQMQQLLSSITTHGNVMKEREVAMNINVAEIYGYLGMYERFTQMLLHEYKTALIYRQRNNQCVILNDLGFICTEKQEWDRAIDYFKQSAPLLDTVSHPELLVYNYNNLAWSYRGKKEYNKALEYMMLAIHHTPKSDTLLLMTMHQVLANHYQSMQEYSLAAKQLAPVIEYFKAKGLRNDFARAYALQAIITWRSGNMTQAKEEFAKAIDMQQYLDPPHKANLAREYGEFCSEFGDKDAVIEALCYANRVYDEMIKGNEQGEALTALYDEELRQSESKQVMYENRVMRYVWMTLGMAVMTLLALGAGAWLYRRQVKRRRGVEDVRDDLQQRLIETSAKDEKNREFLTTLGDDLQELQKIVADSSKQDIIKNLRAITSHVKGMADEDNSALQRANNDFFKRLLERYPMLTANDLRMAAFLRQGLSSKEIAEITFREPRSIDMARSRLRKKIGLPREQDLITFFAAI